MGAILLVQYLVQDGVFSVGRWIRRDVRPLLRGHRPGVAFAGARPASRLRAAGADPSPPGLRLACCVAAIRTRRRRRTSHGPKASRFRGVVQTAHGACTAIEEAAALLASP